MILTADYAHKLVVYYFWHSAIAGTSLQLVKMHSWTVWAQQVLEHTHIQSPVAVRCESIMLKYTDQPQH